ncbi:hypothetical protein DPMN_032273 [Dreissena polymorpha]|uniref:Uncharacterized protein n=1 Tax=Dreissena polymorpha TaxID=45954 RepID=A0A9D4RI34_DREPO|nr:hypothetical protein DPMN_032273 [Dreissena polymorpha]
MVDTVIISAAEVFIISDRVNEAANFKLHEMKMLMTGRDASMQNFVSGALMALFYYENKPTIRYDLFT